VTDGTAPGPGNWRGVRASPRMVVWAVLRVAASIAVVVALYYLLPFDRSTTGVVVTLLVIGLVVFIGLVGYQVRSIIRSPFPGLRAIEALATSVPLFLALFASTYFVMAGLSVGGFGASLTRTDSLYFTVTVFSTVGFGDITAKSEAARLGAVGASPVLTAAEKNISLKVTQYPNESAAKTAIDQAQIWGALITSGTSNTLIVVPTISDLAPLDLAVRFQDAAKSAGQKLTVQQYARVPLAAKDPFGLVEGLMLLPLLIGGYMSSTLPMAATGKAVGLILGLLDWSRSELPVPADVTEAAAMAVPIGATP
jgi:voltage-gated potassium channel